MRSRFSEEQIIGILREQEAGIMTADMLRARELRRDVLRVCGRDVSDAKRLKELEDENGKLKMLLADTMLVVAAASSRSQKQKENHTEGLLDRSEVAKLLNCSPRTVQRLDIPFVRVGRQVRYRLHDVNAFICANLLEKPPSQPSPALRTAASRLAARGVWKHIRQTAGTAGLAPIEAKGSAARNAISAPDGSNG